MAVRLTRAAGLAAPALALLGASAAQRSAPTVPVTQEAYNAQIQPLLMRYCVPCHGDAKPSGDLNIAGFKTLRDIQGQPTRWKRIRDRIADKSMPPASMPQPSQEERDRLATWIPGAIAATTSAAVPDPGRVLIHRLNRVEYNNTIRDLLGVDSHPADSFPADGGGGGGFDNDADTLFVPPILMERYVSAAGEILEKAPHDRIFVCKPRPGLPKRAAARQIFASLASRAYRRPAAPEEIAGLAHLYDIATRRGLSYESAVRFSLKAVLVSPDFLFRVEQNQPGRPAGALSDYEIASRLSYFLWSSMPDDELFRLAASGRLHTPHVLAAQVRRMLENPRAAAFADNFAGQWLRVRDLYTTATPDPNRYPEFTPALRDAMYHETIDFFGWLLHDNESLLNLLDSRYTYLNETLAKHYSIAGVMGSEMRKCILPDRRRGGVLTMGSVLTLTSFPLRTSPVLRGKWVLGELLGDPPPPPPPDAGGLSTDDTPDKGVTFRQRLEKHRSRPQCAGCHARMDPLGFGLENYDATGKWRVEIGNAPVDVSGVLPSGEKFSGPEELKSLLLQRKDAFIKNLSRRMLSYALGRGTESYDEPAVAKIAADTARSGYRSQAMVTAIVESLPFRYRRNETITRSR